MKITHFGHSCQLVESSGTRMLLDPGKFSTRFTEATDLEAVLVTHAHPDHLDLEALTLVIERNPEARILCDEGSSRELASVLAETTTLRPGDHLVIGDATVDAIGGEHEPIHRELPTIPNVGYLIDGGEFYHPGDALVVPEQEVRVLGLPVHAPWMSLARTVDFFREIHPLTAIAIHETGAARLRVYYRTLEALAPEGADFQALDVGEPFAA